MKKTILINALLILFIAACGCSKDNMQDELPPITQTGANTFGFVYDGVVFIPTDSKSRGFGAGGSASGLSITGSHFDTEHYSNAIDATRYTNTENVHYIYIYMYRLASIGIGTYTLDKGGDLSWPYHSYIYMRGKSATTGKWTEYYSYKNSGVITITRKDEDNNVFSGTFSGKLQNQEGTEMVEVTQGRFDINIKLISVNNGG